MGMNQRAERLIPPRFYDRHRERHPPTHNTQNNPTRAHPPTGRLPKDAQAQARMLHSTVARSVWWVGLVVTASAVIAGLLASRAHDFATSVSSKLTNGKPTSILSIFARSAFDWSSSTTPAPLSTTAVFVKAILANKSVLPSGLEEAIVTATGSDGEDTILDVHVGPVRNRVSSRILHEVRELCSASNGDGSGCDPNELDPEFGTTPLHLAELWGSTELVEYLLSIEANPDIFDTVGRQPRNMTFKAFSANSKKAADARLPSGADPEDRCEFPEVTIPLFPHTFIDEEVALSDKLLAAEEWKTSARAALSEVRRLVSEGEPVMVRNMVDWLQADDPVSIKYLTATAFAEAWGHRPVDVGGLPYAKNFGLYNEHSTLGGYMTATAAAVRAGAGVEDTIGSTADAPSPQYVFQVDIEACEEGRELLGRVVEAALPSSGDKPIICPPPSGRRGMESVHYYLGGRGSGSPFHIHSDAINLTMSGKKKWWIVTPRSAVWSRRHIREYDEERKGGPRGESAARGEDKSGSEDSPMECVQRGGDLVYVPGDWGHAARNLEDGTFG